MRPVRQRHVGPTVAHVTTTARGASGHPPVRRRLRQHLMRCGPAMEGGAGVSLTQDAGGLTRWCRAKPWDDVPVRLGASHCRASGEGLGRPAPPARTTSSPAVPAHCTQLRLLDGNYTIATKLTMPKHYFCQIIMFPLSDEIEGHIDYEDNFPDDLSMPIEEQEENNAKETEKKDRKPEKTTIDGTKTQLAAGGNHIGVKTTYVEQGSKMIYDDEDFYMGPVFVNNGTGATKSTDSNTDESWLDGYPVTQEAVEEEEAEEEGDKIDGSMGMEDDITSDQPNQVGIGKAGGSSLEKKIVPIVAVPSQTHYADGIKGIPVALTPTSAPENVSISNGSEDIIRYISTTPMGFVTQELASLGTVTSLNLATQETSTVLSLIDHIPLPEEEEMTTSPTQELITMSSQNGVTELSADDSVEQEILSYGLGGKLLTTFEPCVGTECSSSDKGTVIAIGVTVLCLLLLAAIFAVWCFRKRQQKTSVYKLNGKDHPGHQLQQIEMHRV
ncbi:UNVERIFIED_CONTAM: hypothetical protein K2H54_047565 [Gekko kuhli]